MNFRGSSRRLLGNARGAAVGLVDSLTCPLEPMDAIFSFLGVAGNRSIVKLEVFLFRPKSSRLFAGVRGVCPHFVPISRVLWVYFWSNYWL